MLLPQLLRLLLPQQLLYLLPLPELLASLPLVLLYLLSLPVLPQREVPLPWVQRGQATRRTAML